MTALCLTTPLALGPCLTPFRATAHYANAHELLLDYSRLDCWSGAAADSGRQQMIQLPMMASAAAGDWRAAGGRFAARWRTVIAWSRAARRRAATLHGSAPHAARSNMPPAPAQPLPESRYRLGAATDDYLLP